jgi:hypothetical protein
MEKEDCVLPEGGNKRKARWYPVIPVLALLFQLVPPAFLWALSTAAYAEPRRVPECWERPVSLLVLGFSAGLSLVLGSIGVYGLLTRARLTTALVLILVCYVPGLLGGAIYLHGLLVFLAWV